MAEFTAAVENYDRFMGRYASGLAPKFADAAGVRAGMRVLDVGCGPDALAVELAGRVGEDNGHHRHRLDTRWQCVAWTISRATSP